VNLSRINANLVAMQMGREGKINDGEVTGIEEVANELLRSDNVIQKAREDEVSAEDWVNDILKFGLEKAVSAVRIIKDKRMGIGDPPRIPTIYEMKQMQKDGRF